MYRLTERRSRGSYAALLRRGSFFRFFTGQGISSLGDWIALVAILTLVDRITDHNEFAVAAMLLARLLPALLFGPVAGVIVDRWNRKRVMVFCDLGRAALIATLPFIESVSRAVPVLNPVVLLFVVSAVLEMLTLLWQPAKDASVPGMVPSEQLGHANALVLFAAYGTLPISGAAFGLLVAASKWLGQNFEAFREFRVNQEHLAFFFDAFTFTLSALIIATLRIPRHTVSRRRLDLRAVWEEFVEGLRFIRRHPMIRPWVIGIGMIFVGIGAFLSIAIFHVTKVLGAGPAGFGLLVTTVGVGLGLGFAFAGTVSRFVARDVFFSFAVVGLGASLFGFASVSTLSTGAFVGVLLGLFAGFAYPSGMTLMQENVDDELRGRILASVHSVIRLALVGSLALAPALAKVIDKLVGGARLVFLGQEVDLGGTRVAMWLGGLSILAAGAVTTRAVRARWLGLRMPLPGVFFVFEGGEGAGKSTQIERLAKFLESRGREVLVTREPGGTTVGRRIREILLDPLSAGMSARSEALLYAADRAQHVEEVIRPALERGKIVISDRYIDSSLAYQGLGRKLGIEAVLDLSSWATEGLLPDLVFLLDFDPRRGLERAGSGDRIEREGLAFHEAVREAYRLLSSRYPERFVVIDAAQSAEQLEAQVRRRVAPYLERGRRDSQDLPSGAPGRVAT